MINTLDDIGVGLIADGIDKFLDISELLIGLIGIVPQSSIQNLMLLASKSPSGEYTPSMSASDL